jgi:hypothetical protein
MSGIISLVPKLQLGECIHKPKQKIKPNQPKYTFPMRTLGTIKLYTNTT